eukprot:10193412-Prorocentrum_lima.AAC.1
MAHEAGWKATPGNTLTEISPELMEFIKQSYLPPDLYANCTLEQMLIFERVALHPEVPPVPGMLSRE